MKTLLKEISECNVCEKHLALGARPVVTGSVNSRIVIIGQAPGLAVHNTGIPWNDKSGENLRTWMDVSREDFYDVNKFAITPMGFCYPGRGKSGDLPPRKECAPLWHKKLFDSMPNIKLIMLIGKYAQNYYLKNRTKSSLTETVKNYKEYLPEYLVLPHPSPLNNIWQKRNEWFKQEVIPDIKDIIRTIID